MTLYGLLKALDFERLAGTAGEQKAIEIITAYLKQCGLKPKLEAFEIHGFASGTADISCNGNIWEATPFGLCGDSVTEGELVFLENADVLLQAPGRYKDKIVLYYHATKRLYDLYEQTKVKAFIGIGAPFRKQSSASHRQKRAEEILIPSAMVSYATAEQLLKLDGKKIRLSIRQKADKKKAHNIVTDIKGKGRDEVLTLLVGHYDTVARSHGAGDNAGGTVCLLKAAEYFAKHQPERDLRIICCSGEEMGLLGSFAYAKKHEEELAKRCRLVINVDLAGDPIGKNTLITLGTKELQGYAGGVLKEHGLLFDEQLGTYSSDCMPFTPLEIPALNIARLGGKALYFIHTEDDKARNVSQKGLEGPFKATVTLLSHMLNADIYPVSKAIDDSLRDKIEAYLYQSRLEKPELKWMEKYKK
jgi:Zn-dependent M28 family amino/carboxypeptidase